MSKGSSEPDFTEQICCKCRENMKGEGIKKVIKQTLQTLKPITDPLFKTKKYIKTLALGRKDYPPKMRTILTKYGDLKITKITVCRHPLSQLLMKALDAVSFGKISSRIENQPYDKLYHLYMLLELEGTSNKISLEKNQVLNSQVNPPLKPRTECTEVQFTGEFTPNQLLESAKSLLGDKFFTYDAVNNNCQDFIVALIKGSNIGGTEDIEFIKQDTEKLFKNLEKTTEITKKLTDLAGRANIITEGLGIQKSDNYYVQSVVFEKEKFDVKSSREWLKKNNYIVKKPDVTDTQIRYRQVNPKYIKKMGFDKFRTKKIGKKTGISLIIAYK